MTQVACTYRQTGDEIDHTPGSAVTAGDVIVLGTNVVSVARRDIAANAKGALSIRGLFQGPKVTGAISKGVAIYWDADGDPVGATAGTGAFTTDSTKGPFAGWAAAAALSGDETVDFGLRSQDDPSTVLRSALGQDDLAVYGLALETWRVTGTGALLGASAGTPAGAFGITYGTFGSASPKVVGEAASGNSKTDRMRRSFTLPAEYVAGETVTLRVRCKEAVGAATVATSIDAEVFEGDKAAGIGSDLCATAAQDVTTSTGNKDFTVTPTGLAPGDLLDIQLTGVTNDTGGSVGTILEIYDVALLLDVKG